MKKMLKIVWIVSLMFSLWACQQDEMMDNQSLYDESQSFPIRISTTGLMDQYTVTSRGTDVKTTDEQAINTLHIFIFDADGNYLEAADGKRYQGYRMLSEGNSVLNVDREGWADTQKASNAIVVAVANVEEGVFTLSDGDIHPSQVSDLNALKNLVYAPHSEAGRTITELPETGMPMFGMQEGCNLTKTANNSIKSIEIEMKALMARVDVSIQINSPHTDKMGQLPSFTLTGYQVKNMPQSVPLTVPATTIASAYLDKSYTSEVETVHNKNGVIDFHFYVFENIQTLPTNYSYTYPDRIKEDQKQQFKPDLAEKYAAQLQSPLVLQLAGKYVTYNGSSYEVLYTLYLGANHTNDFAIHRNKQYKNNITIKGITKTENSPEGTVTLDLRTHVEESNPYYVSILKERLLDSHFNVVPMDFYLFTLAGTGTVDIEIMNAATDSWLRMEKVEAETMQASNYAPGTGIQSYFYKDLVTSTSRLANNVRYEGLTHRDRIYLYVDENVNVCRLNSTDARTRTATLKLTYKENGVAKGTCELLIEQANLLQVTFHADEEQGYSNKSIYIEMYEEYLDYRDPLDEYTSNKVYSGLPWQNYTDRGTAIITSLLNGDDCYKNYYEGWKYTETIVGKIESGYSFITLNENAATAAGYCYLKNKRNSDGTISNHKWYLPGIRELERILEDYYAEYTEFQNNYYWSSAEGERVYDWLKASYYNNNARATKAYIEGGSFKYYESDTKKPYTGETGTGGYANRKTILRIRCARIDNQY